jgi:hypothetical protein
MEASNMKNRTKKKQARVAQWLEHWSSKPGVDSSILSSGIKYFILFFFSFSFYEQILLHSHRILSWKAGENEKNTHEQ